MQQLFSTEDISERHRFKAWMDVWHDRFMQVEAERIGDRQFCAKMQGAVVGGVRTSLVTFGGQKTEVTPRLARRNDRHDALAVIVQVTGTSFIAHKDHNVVKRAGDMTIVDASRTSAYQMQEASTSLLIEVPRDRIERNLGPASLYAGLPITSELATNRLVRHYFEDLIRLGDKMTAETAVRMAHIGLDLIVASVAERMARETPKSLQSTVVVQRAKAHVETHLGDSTLDPPQLAMALGISLRHLQQLFQEHGQQVGDWIWRRRLETAAQHLSDPTRVHEQIGAVAYNCGFINQAHFSRRFKDRFGVSPIDYRRSCLTAKPSETI